MYHGKFGYNVYKDNVLITWTDKTSYSYTPNGSPYGTYKVIATYKSYSDIQSDPATITLEEKKKEPEKEEKENNKEEPKEEPSVEEPIIPVTPSTP